MSRFAPLLAWVLGGSLLLGCPAIWGCETVTLRLVDTEGDDDTADDDTGDDDTGDDDDTSDDDDSAAVDADGDGWPAADECDDNDMQVNPMAPEICNGVDNDCDSVVDVASANPFHPDCWACTIELPGPYATIQEAVDAAGTGDVICVGPGTWDGNIDYLGKEIALLGLAGLRVTFLDGGQAGPVVRFGSGEGPDSVLQGFTLTGGEATGGGGITIDASSPSLEISAVSLNHANSGGGIWMNGSSANLWRVDVADNTSDGPGGGVYMYDATPDMVGLSIRGNEAAGAGGGMALNASSPILYDVAIAHNSAHEGGGIDLAGSHPVMTRLDLEGNYSATSGGGLRLVGSSPGLDDFLIQANNAASGGGLFVGAGSAPSLSDGILVTNSALNHGGALMLEEAGAVLTHVTLLSNVAPQDGGGIHAVASELTVVNSLLHSNRAVGDGGGLWLGGGTAVLTNVALVDNEATAGGGAFVDSGAPTITYCDAYQNTPDPYAGIADPTGIDGNVSVDPAFLDLSNPEQAEWDLHLGLGSDLIGAGDPGIVDPDGSRSDIGPYGGPGAGGRDRDGDGYPEWWQPGPYDPAYALDDWDCDDSDESVYPGSGC